MASVNKLSLYIGIPIIIVIYVAYLFYVNLGSDNASQQRIIDQHYENLINTTPQALVLGGSNAIFGLSAQMLSKETGLHFLNFSLRSEGFNNQNYREYISSLNSLDADSVEVVVYSSIQFSRELDRDLVRSNFNIFGESADVQLIPNKTFSRFMIESVKSVIEHRKLVFDEPEFYMINNYGDLIHSSVNCDYSRAGRRFESLSVEFQVEKVKDQVEFLKLTFPKAQILFVFPAEHYLDQGAMIENFSLVISKLPSYQNVAFIVDKTELSASEICDTEHHPNEIGRLKRTASILKELQALH
ncbi:hypothetical protein [Thiomicrospira sp. ALE5]|uniref:hypothetical protein n=1 Tax=Thiomicrospira sp. ALE5 TaxID=748650 RepID=UPI0008F3D6D9|nr:hypothetical protein [Thiomicrospira sp. ALE5]SFR55578.1 hypothetical protein SAMN03092900_1153 [Thiomicrospira sp. ALE5]